MKLFVESAACRSGRHCQACLNGDAFRQQLAKQFTMPKNTPGVCMRPQGPPAPKSPPESLKPIPRERWPIWAKVLARRARPGDIGVGDTAQRLAAKVGGERYKRIRKRLKIPCNCTAKQAEWNALYPYLET